MGDGYDRCENEGGGGGSFVMGLLTGTVLGAGLGMLFAPKSGSELRGQISEQANTIANKTSEQAGSAPSMASAGSSGSSAGSSYGGGSESIRGAAPDQTRSSQPGSSSGSSPT